MYMYMYIHVCTCNTVNVVESSIHTKMEVHCICTSINHGQFSLPTCIMDINFHLAYFLKFLE